MAQSAALISTEELARRMGAPALRIFDCTTYLRPRPEGGYNAESGRANYDKGHIPGAAFLDLGGRAFRPAVQAPLHPAAARSAHQGVRRQGHRPRHLRRALQPRHAELGDARVVDAARRGLRRCRDPRRRARQMEGREPPALDRGHDLSAGHAQPARTARDLRRQERHQGRDRQDRHADLECAQPRPAQGHGRRGLRPRRPHRGLVLRAGGEPVRAGQDAEADRPNCAPPSRASAPRRTSACWSIAAAASPPRSMRLC